MKTEFVRVTSMEWSWAIRSGNKLLHTLIVAWYFVSLCIVLCLHCNILSYDINACLLRFVGSIDRRLSFETSNYHTLFHQEAELKLKLRKATGWNLHAGDGKMAANFMIALMKALQFLKRCLLLSSATLVLTSDVPNLVDLAQRWEILLHFFVSFRLLTRPNCSGRIIANPFQRDLMSDAGHVSYLWKAYLQHSIGE